ncbi:MAG: multifunctional fatty acid oxidation complex subunit alpha [Planctomycetota bacterium]|nr:MAG: multifunctional fatty acid oxidation complex subunit alpha [Planctomycetota bacterium]REK48756.1 MAG: multifunctional fatty acid oxidation complex subunit alpha [Planctomycetota bacterium]
MMAAATITLSFPEDDIAALTLDMPDKGANILSTPVLEELDAHLKTLETRKDLAGLIIRSGKPNMFIAGADLREFAASLDIEAEETVAMCRRGQTLFQRLSKTPFVTVAAIGGICLGGGAELAIWCDRRILSNDDKTQFGFPEVKLGLMPGWGGTARTPRIVGLSNAVEMVTSGESVDAATAVKMGLATQAVAADDLDAAAIRLVRAEQQSGEYREDRQTYDAPIEISEIELMFLGATASGYIQQKTDGNYPAPITALETMLGAAGVDIDAACQMEAEAMGGLFGSPVNRALLNVFFLTDRNKKDTGLAATAEVTPGEINSIAVVGAGIMGQGITAAAVRRKIPATITDLSAEALAVGVQKVLEEVSYNKKIKGADVERSVEYAPLINGTTSPSETAACDLVIEAVVEREDIKKQLYAELEPLLAPEAILASNTSTIPITRLAEGLKRPDRFAGLHFFNPVRKMPLVEVIRGEQTSDETVATLVAYAKRIGKSPIVVADGPGFLVNRLLLPYMSEAAQLLTEGASAKAIDRAAKKFGMPMGPLNLFDVVGLDTALYAGAVMKEAFPERVIEPAILPALVEAGRLGVKSGLGFYSYQNKKKRPQPDPEFDKLLAPLVTEENDFNNADLRSRLFLPMLLEATRALEEGIVRDVRDVDLALIFGIGYPPFKGGLLFGSDVLGAERILEMLKPFEDLGPRYQPTEMLLNMAQTGEKFYQ